MEERRKTILFADDEPWFYQGMVDELEDAGYRVVTVATSGSEVMTKLRSDLRVDLVILDIMMPVGNVIDVPEGGRRTGVTVLEHIRQEMRSKIPVVILTVIEDQAVHERIEDAERRAGIEPTILVKPVAPLDLVEEVAGLIGEGANPAGAP